jgi:hypothetical protein
MHTLPHTVLPPTTLEDGYDKDRIPRSQGFGLIHQPRPNLDPASTPTTGQQERKTDVAQDSGSFHRLIPDIITVSGDGQPFLRHVATATYTGIDKTSPQDTPSVLASSYPIKGQVRGLQRGGGQKPSASKQRHATHRSTSQAITLVLFRFL